jgi:hypothetical protein
MLLNTRAVRLQLRDGEIWEMQNLLRFALVNGFCKEFVMSQP